MDPALLNVFEWAICFRRNFPTSRTRNFFYFLFSILYSKRLMELIWVYITRYIIVLNKKMRWMNSFVQIVFAIFSSVCLCVYEICKQKSKRYSAYHIFNLNRLTGYTLRNCSTIIAAVVVESIGRNTIILRFTYVAFAQLVQLDSYIQQ